MILVPVMNSLRWAMPFFGCLKYNTSDDVEYLIMDNGSTEPVEDRLRHYIKPKRLNFIRYETNQGLINNLQEAYKICESDLLMFLHNDCYIYEKNWDQRIRRYFEEIPKLGMAGFFGAQGCLSNGGRLQVVPNIKDQKSNAGISNMLEAEIHGQRLTEEWKAVAIFDSFAMVMNMDLLRKTNGFDMRYKFHHFFDRDISLESLRHGYKNIVVDVPCHHIGSVTAQNPEYQKWQEKVMGNATDSIEIHNINQKQFEEKWKEVLPICIGNDFHFMVNSEFTGNQFDFKGNKILGYKNYE